MIKRVTAGLLRHKGKFLIARRPPDDPQAGQWEFPGGKIEEGESPEACLKRELWEELAIDVSVGEFFTVSTHTYKHGMIQLLAYFVTWDGGEIEKKAHDQIAWAAPREFGDYDFLPADIAICEALQRRFPLELLQD